MIKFEESRKVPTHQIDYVIFLQFLKKVYVIIICAPSFLVCVKRIFDAVLEPYSFQNVLAKAYARSKRPLDKLPVVYKMVIWRIYFFKE